MAALLESGWVLRAREEHWTALKSINEKFPIKRLTVASEPAHRIPIFIDHPQPITMCGDVSRPLIFPEWMFTICGSGEQMRKWRCSFIGFPNKKRVHDLLAMYERSFGRVNVWRKKCMLALSDFIKWQCAVRALNTLLAREARKHDCVFMFTSAGRASSNKVYEKSYWDLLAQSQSTYCPAGDFGWSYRFYECMVAGAMPVVDAALDDQFTQGFSVLRSIPGKEAFTATTTSLQANCALTWKLLTAREELTPQRLLNDV